MKVGFVQNNPIFGEKQKNFIQIEEKLKNEKADLIVLPELFATGYNFISKKEAYSLAENENGETRQFLEKLSKKTGAIIVAGFVEKEQEKIYNSAMIVSNSNLFGIYRKLHLYYKEKRWFFPGNLQIKVYDLDGIKIGIMICFDWFFPETMRTLALLGADIIAHPSNLVLPYCQKAMITRCLENRVYAVTSNRIGEELRGDEHFRFTGASQITSFDGKVILSAPSDQIFVDFVEIDIKEARNKHINAYNDIFNDRRINYYRL